MLSMRRTIRIRVAFDILSVTCWTNDVIEKEVVIDVGLTVANK